MSSSYTTRTLRTDNTARVALTIATTLSDRDAAAACARIQGNSFAAGIVSDFRRYGRLFPNKLAWMHKLALEQIAREKSVAAGVSHSPRPSLPSYAYAAPATKPAAVSSTLGYLPVAYNALTAEDRGVEAAFAAAEQSALEAELDAALERFTVAQIEEPAIETNAPAAVIPAPVVMSKPAAAPAARSFPRIAGFLTPVSERLKSGASVTVEYNGHTVEIKRAGTRSRFPGSFWVTDGREYGSNTLYGRIAPDGTFTGAAGLGHPEGVAVLECLSKMDADPAGFCAAEGKRAGRCCFCAKPLSDETAMGFGYGGTCAKHYGLPYGVRALRCARVERDAKIAANHEASVLTAV